MLCFYMGIPTEKVICGSVYRDIESGKHLHLYVDINLFPIKIKQKSDIMQFNTKM